MNILLVHNINAYQNDQISDEEIVYFNEISILEKRLGQNNIHKYIAMNKNPSKISLFFNIWFNISHYFKIKKVIKEHKIDIVHVHNFFPLITPSIFYGAKSMGVTTIQTLHSYGKYCLNKNFYYMGGSCVNCPTKGYIQGIKKKCYENSTLQSIAVTLVNYFYSFINYEKKIDAYFVLSNIQKNFMIEFDKTNTLKNKIFLKPNFIKMAQYDIKPEDKRDYIYIGRLEYQFGVQFLLDFWKTLPRNFILNIIGRGSLQNQIDKSRWSHINYIGRINYDDTPRYIAQSKYLIYPSLMYEASNTILIESMSLGTPVIAFNYGSRKEILKNAKNSFVVSLENFNDVIKKTKSVIGKEYQEISLNAKKFAMDYDEEVILDKQIELYDKLLFSK